MNAQCTKEVEMAMMVILVIIWNIHARNVLKNKKFITFFVAIYEKYMQLFIMLDINWYCTYILSKFCCQQNNL